MFSRYKHSLVAATLSVSCWLAGATPLPAAEITLPPETAKLVESSLPGYATALALCSTCHSADYQRMQPPNLPRTYWKATVVKMQKTFGAPIPDEAIEPITDYLVKTYGAERATVSPPRERGAPKQGR
ncbi:MAG: hypothetical protein Q7S40_17280 [Opitutaceae bacterium]|nr:hypothetical protein [Opitutaceae bacterium]